MNTQIATRRPARFALPVVVSVALLSLVGCSTTPAPEAVSLATPCPDGPLVSTVFLDVTGSSFTGHIGDEYVEAISQIATRTAACSGTMGVETFGESSGQTVSLLKQSFEVEAPTKNAQRRKQKKLVATAVTEVKNQLDVAAARTPAAATDVLGLLRLVQETKGQLPDSTHEVFVLTDGFTNIGVNPAGAESLDAAVELVDLVDIPDLTGVDLMFSGIGRSVTTVPSSVVEQVVAFWSRVCERTNADSCTAVTQWQG